MFGLGFQTGGQPRCTNGRQPKLDAEQESKDGAKV